MYLRIDSIQKSPFLFEKKMINMLLEELGNVSKIIGSKRNFVLKIKVFTVENMLVSEVSKAKKRFFGFVG